MLNASHQYLTSASLTTGAFIKTGNPLLPVNLLQSILMGRDDSAMLPEWMHHIGAMKDKHVIIEGAGPGGLAAAMP
jgi:hypothetical protein